MKNTGVQCFRAILFIGIIAFHCHMPYSQILWCGVVSFFVISAYYLTKKLCKASSGDINVLENIRHRLLRLYPVYILLLIGAVFVTVIFFKKLPIMDTLYHLLLSQNINWMVTNYKSDLVYLTAHTWTLSIEMYLFVLWILIYKCIRKTKYRMVFCWVMLVVAVTYRTVGSLAGWSSMTISLCPIAHADAFAIGSLMAIFENTYVERDRRFKRGWVIALAIAGICFVLLSIGVTATQFNVSYGQGYQLYSTSNNYLNHPITCNIYLYIALITVALFKCSQRLALSDSNILVRCLAKIGDISYTGYLIHWPIRFVLMIATDSWVIAFIGTTIATIVGSIILERLLKLFKTNPKVTV